MKSEEFKIEFIQDQDAFHSLLEFFCVAEVAPRRAQELMLGVDTERGP